MYETRHARPLSRRAFAIRLAYHGLVSLAIITFALGVGVVGYHMLGHLSWVDSLLNASMILGGMGPVDPLPSDGAKVFASFYALFSGLAFIGITAILLAPVVHRVLHRFHMDDSDES